MNELERLINELVDGAVEIVRDEMFQYDCDDGGTIYYDPTEEYMTDCNLDWKDFLFERFNFNLTPENWFVMSILHELGHHYTIEYFTSEEWNKMCNVIEDDDRKAVNFDHFNQQNEIVATEWAIAYYNANPTEMHELCSAINTALEEVKHENA